MKLRLPAVAGLFYPGDAPSLKAMVAALLAPFTALPGARPKALLVPHAGYLYSGRTAAHAYALLQATAQAIQRVVLLGPTHRVAVHGVALPGSEAFATPLGVVPIDMQARDTIADLPGVCIHDGAHAGEHSLEVQLPFLQSVLGHFTLLPLAVGHADAAEVANVVDALWGGPETLFVVSTDLSHYRPYPEAQRLDHDTVARILALDTPIDPVHACGAAPLNGFLNAARAHHLHARLLEACNSGDTAGDHSRVVGYCSIAFEETGSHVH